MVERTKENALALMPTLTAAMSADYDAWTNRADKKSGYKTTSRRTYEVKAGSSYAKIIAVDTGGSRSVAGFVVLKEGKFPIGTLLMAAGWKAPATNFARGDLFEPESFEKVRWTGIG